MDSKILQTAQILWTLVIAQTLLDNVNDDIDDKAKKNKKICGITLNMKEEDFIISPTNKMYAMIKFVEIVAAVFSSILYVHFAAYRYDVDYHWDEDIDHIVSKIPNHFEDEEGIRVHNIQQIVFESFFLLIMILNFFVEY